MAMMHTMIPGTHVGAPPPDMGPLERAARLGQWGHSAMMYAMREHPPKIPVHGMPIGLKGKKHGGVMAMSQDPHMARVMPGFSSVTFLREPVMWATDVQWDTPQPMQLGQFPGMHPQMGEQHPMGQMMHPGLHPMHTTGPPPPPTSPPGHAFPQDHPGQVGHPGVADHPQHGIGMGGSGMHTGGLQHPAGMGGTGMPTGGQVETAQHGSRMHAIASAAHRELMPNYHRSDYEPEPYPIQWGGPRLHYNGEACDDERFLHQVHGQFYELQDFEKRMLAHVDRPSTARKKKVCCFGGGGSTSTVPAPPIATTRDGKTGAGAKGHSSSPANEPAPEPAPQQTASTPPAGKAADFHNDL